MSAWQRRLGTRLLLGGVLACAALPATAATLPGAPLVHVAVTVPPQAWLVRRLAGDRAEVEVMLPPGVSEHTYEPTPQQVARLSAARLVVEVGHPALLFERRLLDAMRSERRMGTLVVDMSRHAPPESDPHLWVSPAAMRGAAVDVASALAKLDPAAAALYARRLPGVLAAIDDTARDVRAQLCAARGRRLYVYHPAWAHLLHDCGITQVAIEAEGKEPSARQLVALVEAARRDRARMLFVQRGFSARPAEQIAQEIGARVVAVDPLAEDWPTNLRAVARLFREALDG